MGGGGGGEVGVAPMSRTYAYGHPSLMACIEKVLIPPFSNCGVLPYTHMKSHSLSTRCVRMAWSQLLTRSLEQVVISCNKIEEANRLATCTSCAYKSDIVCTYQVVNRLQMTTSSIVATCCESLISLVGTTCNKSVIVFNFVTR